MANNNQGVSIKDAQHLSVPTDSTKIPVSDGSGSPKHITLSDIKTYLADELAPKWTDATCKISCTKSGISTTMEIGSAKPTASDFSHSGSTASAVSAAATAQGGALDTTNTGITIQTSNATSFVAQAIRVYAQGSTQVKSSKGNPTNKTASNATTLLSSATVNSDIDATTFVIKAITKTAAYIITYVYALYANTSSISTIAKLAIDAKTTWELSFPAESSANKHTFDIPASYKNISVEVLNTLSGKYEGYGTTKFNITDVTHNDASGASVNYKRYTRNDGTNGATTFRISFTK